jgi:hypothetical protein
LAVNTDRWDPYIASVREHVPEAEGKIGFDNFQVAKHLSDAVDEIRRKENQTLPAAGDDRLAGTAVRPAPHPGGADKDIDQVALDGRGGIPRSAVDEGLVRDRIFTR